MRCPWGGIADPLYARYHDEEWGVPKADDRALFEKLVLEGFQAGLSWLTILRKRENFRRAFHGFDAARIARYGAKDIARLMADPGIVRNRLKVEATIDNARALLALQERTSLAGFLWGFLDGRPQINRHASFKAVPAETPVSKAISKALKAEGFRFVGPTTVYAFMQATGMVNDHLVGCHRHGPCAELQRRFKMPGSASEHDRSQTTAAAIGRARARAWQRMLSGRRLDLLDPAPQGHRGRGHRPWPRPGRALERPDGRRARLLGRPARAAGGGDRHRHAPGFDEPLAARGAAARRPGICDRRPHQPLQGRHRPRLQGLRAASCWRPSTAASACRRRCPSASPWPSRWPIASPPIYEATQLAGFTETEANRYFGVPRGVPEPLRQRLQALDAVPIAEAQAEFLARFEELSGTCRRSSAALFRHTRSGIGLHKRFERRSIDKRNVHRAATREPARTAPSTSAR